MAPSIPAILYPIRFSTANPVLRVAPSTGVAESVTLSVSADTDYYLSGDNQSDDLIAKFKTMLDSMTGSQVFTCTLSAANVLTVQSDSGNFQLLWANGSTTLSAGIFGAFGTDQTGGSTYTMTYPTQGYWTAGIPFRTDTRTEPVTAGHMVETIDGQSRVYDFTSNRGERSISYHLVSRSKILTEYATGDIYGALEYAWVNGIVKGRTVRIYDDRSSRTSTSYETHRIKSRQRPWSEMGVSFIQRYEVSMDFREV